jgi:hypothetical protein
MKPVSNAAHAIMKNLGVWTTPSNEEPRSKLLGIFVGAELILFPKGLKDMLPDPLLWA